MKRNAEDRRGERKKRKEENESVIARYNKINAANTIRSIESIIPKELTSAFEDRFDFVWRYRNKSPKEEIEAMFQLERTNMKEMYEKSTWLWNDKKERATLRNRYSRFIVAYSKTNKDLAGFILIRFIVDPDDQLNVAYVLDLQIDKKYQNQGLGGLLLQMTECLANHTQMEYCRLTVFRHNTSAYHFYTNKMQYKIDPLSPSNFHETISLISFTNSVP